MAIFSAFHIKNLWKLTIQVFLAAGCPTSHSMVSVKALKKHKALTLTSGLAVSFFHPQPDSRFKGYSSSLTPVPQTNTNNTLHNDCSEINT